MYVGVANAGKHQRVLLARHEGQLTFIIAHINLVVIADVGDSHVRHDHFYAVGIVYNTGELNQWLFLLLRKSRGSDKE